jgi:hypothetical protein
VNPKSRWIISVLVEIPVYAVIIVAYYYLVLSLLGNWVTHLFETDKRLYAAGCLALILAQGILLELTTTQLLRVVRKRMD